MMRKFKILRGFVSPNTRRILTMNAQPRQRRIPLSQIPVPSFYHPELQPIFRHGWRACERGLEIHQCPHTSADEHTQTMRRAWEYGYTECFNRNREGRAQLTTAMIDNIQQTEEEVNDEYHYLTGWESARAGYANHSNPHEVPSNEYAFWNSGWNDFMNNH